MMEDVGGSSGGGGASPRAYMRDSSVHRSYYRCVSIHGTHGALVEQNVAFDVIGHCYYLEDGVEERNRLLYNLAAHIHFIGAPGAGDGGGQFCADVQQSDTLTLPADVTASGFYVTNAANTLVGNTASGGWAGFSFPTLPAPIKLHRHLASSIEPAAKTLLRFEGNTAHSSGWWWSSAGTICIRRGLQTLLSTHTIVEHTPMPVSTLHTA